jgi:GNAT superfamily N-acetyltransferase
MPIDIQPVENARDLKAFIHVPERVHGTNPGWLPPLYMDEYTFFNPKKNKAFSVCETQLWLAMKEGVPVGRVMGIIHHPYNEQQQIQSARFSHLEAIDDLSVTRALLETVSVWAAGQGMQELVGPFGFSDKDPEGLQITGFEHPSILVTATNAPYLPKHLEELGFEKKIDCLDYLLDLDQELPPSYARMYERTRRASQVQVLDIASRRQLRPWVIPVFELVNVTYRHLYGFVPMDQREIRELADRFLPLLNPHFVKVAINSREELVGFVVGIPHLTPGIQKAGGKLFPIGWWHILQAYRNADQLDLMLGAVREDFRGRGVNILLGWHLMHSARERGIHRFESHLILETNQPMRAEFEKVGGQLHKTFRIFRKAIF